MSARARILAPSVSGGRAVWTMTLVSLACVLNYYDRNLLGVLIEPIKAELKFSDSQMGLISGLAFAIVYSLSAVPVAMLADRGGRIRILSAALGLWSLMTGACGLVRSFSGFFLARLGVGLGEAGGLPASHAVIAEHFTEAWRARALSVFAVMSYLGMSLGTAVGGIVAAGWGWRTSFFAGAVPGLILALFLLTLKDTPRAQRAAEHANLKDTAELLRRRSFLWLCIGLGLAMIGNYAMQAWGPTYFVRQFGRNLAEVGVLYSLATAPAQIAGTLIGGYIADVLQKRDERWPLWIVAASFGAALPLNLLFLTIPDFHSAILFMIPANIIGSCYIAPAYALAQKLSGSRLRATAAALLLMITTLIGQGAGPTVVGWLSDVFASAAGVSSLRWALMSANGAFLLGIVAFALSGRRLRSDAVEANAIATRGASHG